MRRGHRNKPIFGLVFWTLVLGGTSLYTAWKFEWLSVDFTDLVGARTDAPEKAEVDAAPSLAAGSSEALQKGVAVDSAVFTEQSEPAQEPAAEVLLERPVPESDASARLRMLQQRQPLEGGNRTQPKPINADSAAQIPQSEFPQDEFDSRSLPENTTVVKLKRPELFSAEEKIRATSATSTTPVASAVPNSQVIQASNEEPQPAATRPAAPANKNLQAIDKLLEEGDTLAAHRELSKMYWADPADRDQLRDRIEKTAEIIYFSPQPHFIEPYVVQTEDQFSKFAKTYNVPWQYLARLNRVDPMRIRPGQKLKVIRGPFSAVVDLSRFELTVHAHGYFVRRFDVGIGKQGTSPVGKFKVLEKVVNPQYTDPEGRVVDADDPSNPLGERWLDLGDGYGIHGTIDPNSIGKAESRGCIRLKNQDIEDIYDLLGVGSEVVIRP